MVGICSCDAYVPRYRIDRKLILNAVGWLNSANTALAKGDKAVANFDEDPITMAVAAGISSLKGFDRSEVEGVYFASTTMPYRERSNAGIVVTALGLNEHIRAADFGGCLKAGTSALISALESVAAKGVKKILVCASDCRLGKPATPQEMIFGDAAAALLVGDQDVIAEFKGSYSVTYDFVDHYRGEFSKFDRQWEERWIRDIGFGKFIPEVIKGLLDKYQLKITDFSKVIYPCYYAEERKKINKVVGVTPEMEQSNFLTEIGDAGTAQSFLMLVGGLESAKPGDKILVVSFGSGCDALYFEVTKSIEHKKRKNGISGCLANKAALNNYEKYLVWRNILPGDLGMRSEQDLWTRWSLLWRRRKGVLGLCGSKCKKCGTVQYPPQRICVNPNCGAVDEMADYFFSEKIGHIVSYTGDMLAASSNPPAIYGTVKFEGGGKFAFDFTDCELETLAAGMPVAMSFRVKYYDTKRDIKGYFWKAVPMKEGK